MSRTFSSEEKAKLSRLIGEGIVIHEEIKSLKDGLNETVKALSEEMGIKPTVLKKAISIAQKSTFTDVSNDHELLTNILETVGRTE